MLLFILIKEMERWYFNIQNNCIEYFNYVDDTISAEYCTAQLVAPF